MCARRPLVALGAALGVLASCASAPPFLHPAQPAGAGRLDVVAGGVAAMALGSLRDDERPGRTAGVGPHLRLHVGLPEQLEARAGWTGDAGIVGARWAPALDERRKWRLSVGLDLSVGIGAEDLGPRVGGDLAMGFGRSWNDLFHVWMLATAGGSRAAGRDGSSGATRWRGGAVLGLGVGFRRLHALIELGAGAELEEGSATRAGLYLVPAFALALRL